MPPIIEVENLGKRYRLGRIGAGSLRNELENTWLRLRGQLPKENKGDFWALKDVSFTVNEGEVLGIIGRNGAGKSTLLKLLSRITEPTTGRAILRGRVASLLEVGTGFHPELSGRENIFLNGAIMGMSRSEVARKFDEIVDFAGTEQFLDTPVKRYSSGMRVRLGFAVAAHLEPEVLIIDEVLAVGDAEFQRRCLGKMKDVATQGRTVLFVSHDLAAVRKLCSFCQLIHDGRLASCGTAEAVVREYVAMSVPDTPRDDEVVRSAGGIELRFPQFVVRHEIGQRFELTALVSSDVPRKELTFGCVLHDGFFNPVAGFSSKVQGVFGRGLAKKWSVSFDLENLQLNAGRYSLSCWIGDRNRDFAKMEHVVMIEVDPGDPFGSGRSLPESWGPFYLSPTWSIAAIDP